MAETNNVDIETNNESNEDNSDSEEDSVDEEMLQFDESTFQRLKQNDPAVSNVYILLNCDHNGKCFFSDIDWEEGCDCIANNTHLKRLSISYIGVPFQRSYDHKYILGEEGHNLPTRQQLQDFFSCINRNSSIKTLSFRSMEISGEFAGGLIEELQGHPSLTKVDIDNGKLGDIVFSALGKVLKHPESKLKGLRLSYGKLDDEGLGVICNALLGNSTMRSLCLNGNLQIAITSSGWRQLSTVLRHPNCKLIDLELRNTETDIEGANLLGDALSGSSVKALNLSYNPCINSAGWRTLFNQLTHISMEKLNLSTNSIDNDGLALLANMCGSIKSMDLSRNSFIGDPGWQSLFNTLQTRGTQLKKLVLSHNHIGNIGLAALCNLLSNMSTLKTLELDGMSHSYDDIYGLGSINSQGWISLFTTLQDSNLNLVKLSLGENQIDDDGIQLLTREVSRMSSIKHLGLNKNRLVTPVGWRALTGYLQHPNCSLKELHLSDNEYNDDTMIVFTSALAHNKTLKSLRLGGYNEDFDDDDDDYHMISRIGWEALSKLLCNKSSILDTYTSNHTLQELGYYIPDELADCLVPYLKLNKNKDKVEVARQKILQTQFSTEDGDSSKLQELFDMELEMMPTAIAWIGRLTPIGWNGKSISGLSLMYNLIRRLPDLFDSSRQKKSVGKRKSKACRGD